MRLTLLLSYFLLPNPNSSRFILNSLPVLTFFATVVAVTVRDKLLVTQAGCVVKSYQRDKTNEVYDNGKPKNNVISLFSRSFIRKN